MECDECHEVLRPATTKVGVTATESVPISDRESCANDVASESCPVDGTRGWLNGSVSGIPV